MENKKINELNNLPKVHSSEEEQLATLTEFHKEQKNRIEVLRKMLENLKQEFSE